MRFSLEMILKLVYICSTLTFCVVLSGMVFVPTGSDSSTLWGYTCLTSDYFPTCGWKLVLRSTLPVQSMT
ncbi:hypothetical protein BgiMline_025265, partial [Biomphalaria glabrata]